jgi:predicted short-subunit dehydrogenase-like oxidoreductase (DUF2520 family)
MFSTVHVIGHGRAGSAINARLVERGHVVTGRDDAELVILCVPDRAIAEVARSVPVGCWIAHVSGSTALEALAPHRQRFSVHPLQTLTTARGPEQLDGAWAAITAETDDAQKGARWLAAELGLRPFEMADEWRVLYHAGATIASNYLVTLFRAASRAFESAGAPPEALVPLMRRTIENGFDLTGPIARGDTATVDAHLLALREHTPELEPMYRALATATASLR